MTHSPPTRTIPLRVLLVVPFVLQLVVTVGLVGWFSFVNGQRAVRDLATRLSREVSDRIEERIQSYSDTPYLFLRTNEAAIRAGIYDPKNFKQLEPYFWQQANLSPIVTSLFYGSEAGDFLMVVTEKPPGIYIRDRSTAPNRQVYDVDAQGRRTALNRASKYDPRTRNWYKQAVQAGKPAWSSIYVFSDTPDLGITPTIPIYDRQGGLQGVIAIDFTLTQISNFLDKLKISESGQAFIMERSGDIVASSASEPPFITVGKERQRLSALKSSQPLIRSTAEQLQQQLGNLATIQSYQQLQFGSGDDRRFVRVTPLKDSHGLDWLMVVVIPEADFMQQIHENTRLTLWLSLGTLVLAVLVGFYTSRWITEPILRLSAASKSIAQGARESHVSDELTQQVKAGGVNELSVLAQSFNQMAQQLRESFIALEKSNEDLEHRVEERTAELASAKDSAEAANAAKSVFFASANHELRTPLNAILGFCQLMSRDSSLTGLQRDRLNTISQSGEHLLGLISDVLEMSKIEAGQAALHESALDLHQLVQSIAAMMGVRAEMKHLQLLVEIAPDVPHYIYGDEGKLRQVLINLIGNAIKFTKEGGVALRVAVKPSLAPDPGMGSDTSLGTGAFPIYFEVEDTGVGIGKHELDKLFQPFVQTESGANLQEGTGLGLAISHQFVKLMGGDITVESVVYRGTVFKFQVQAKLANPTELRQADTNRRVVGVANAQQQYRILIVDDKPENRRLLLEWMQLVGLAVREATNGAEAIEVWEAWEPHLIWMDMRMPVMDGYEATKHIKATVKGQATAIIALTASVFEHERSMVLSAGCNDFVRKPARESTIFAKLAEHLGIEFIYEETEVDTLNQTMEVTPEMLATLPTELIENLRQAVEELDVHAAQGVVEIIRQSNHELANALNHLVINYRFDRLQTLV